MQRAYTQRPASRTSGRRLAEVVRPVVASRGEPLAPDLRAQMETRFEHDFSRVRVHTDSAAAESARAVNAEAYTVGHHVAFGAGRYQPGVVAGRRLLTHELVHVVQQERDGDGVAGSLATADAVAEATSTFIAEAPVTSRAPDIAPSPRALARQALTHNPSMLDRIHSSSRTGVLHTLSDNLLITLPATAWPRLDARLNLEIALNSTDQSATLVALREAGLAGDDAGLLEALAWLRTARTTPLSQAPAAVVNWANSWAARLIGHPPGAPRSLQTLRGGDARNWALANRSGVMSRLATASGGRAARLVTRGAQVGGFVVSGASAVTGAVEFVDNSSSARHDLRRADYASGTEHLAGATVGAANVVSGVTGLLDAAGVELAVAGPIGELCGAFALGYAVGTDVLVPALDALDLLPAASRTSSAAARGVRSSDPIYLGSVATQVGEETRPLTDYLRGLARLPYSTSGIQGLISEVHAAVLAVPATGEPTVAEVIVPPSLHFPEGARFRLRRDDVWSVIHLCEVVLTELHAHGREYRRSYE